MIAFNETMAKLIRRPDEVGGGSEYRPIRAGADLVHPHPAAPADPSIVIDDARRRRIVRDAECLLSVIAYRDVPGRVAIVDAASIGSSAFSLGSGHRLADVFGAAAEVAVGMNVARMLGYGCHKARNVDDAAARAAVVVETAGVHELAHAVASQLDARSGVATLTARAINDFATGTLAVEQSVPRWLEGHGTRWGAAYAILAARAMRLRPRCRREWLAVMRYEFNAHCLPPYDDFAAAVVGIRDDEPIRAILADEEWLATLPTLTPRSRLAAYHRQIPCATTEN